MIGPGRSEWSPMTSSKLENLARGADVFKEMFLIRHLERSHSRYSSQISFDASGAGQSVAGERRIRHISSGKVELGLPVSKAGEQTSGR